MSQVPLYDALAPDYDRFVDWAGRLAHELPFLERLFRAHGVRRVLDAACGTGQHAIARAQRGYQAAGVDLSTAMVEHARLRAAEAGVDVPFAPAGLGDLASLGQEYDAALCLGNSLPHLLTPAAVDAALADFAAVLRPGGLLIIQNRNFDRLGHHRDRFMPPQSHRDGDHEWLFIRFYDWHAETITFNMLRLRRAGAGWMQDVQSTELRPVFRDDLEAGLAAAGFGHAHFFGGYDGSDFDPRESGDLLVVAVRQLEE